MTNEYVYKNYRFFSFISDEPDKDNFRFAIKLGNYVSHEVVGKKLNPKKLDALDRTYHAEIFLDKYKSYFKMYNKSVYNAYMITSLYERLKNDTALYIDLKIPYFYYIKKNDISGHDGRKHYNGIKSVEGEISYSFEQSKTLEKNLFSFKGEIEIPTEKQKKYLYALAKDSGYKVINEEEMTKEIAAKLIGFIKDDIELEIGIQNKFLIYE
ncbi:hypothetical protein [Clostridium intestinale]|uniref:hypothetical protein n=1 Tax=Clostridium intestinale TaxID=36845 RepID=UPI002DD6B4A9|nr:hypothetical protein [Clostridium intestinale]WRY50614.1 hypothetical protein P8F83_18285 [Clostridium intestinale]